MYLTARLLSVRHSHIGGKFHGNGRSVCSCAPPEKNMVISFDNRPNLIIAPARDFARGDAVRVSGGKGDHV